MPVILQNLPGNLVDRLAVAIKDLAHRGLIAIVDTLQQQSVLCGSSACFRIGRIWPSRGEVLHWFLVLIH